MKTFRLGLFLLCLLGTAWAGRAAEYSRQALLAAPVEVKDGASSEVALKVPVSRRREMAQLEIVFSTEAAPGYAFSKDGVSSARGSVNLTLTLVDDDRREYAADIVAGGFRAGAALAKFVTLPPRKAPLRKLVLRGLNVPPIAQIYWVEGREKLSTGADEDLSNCEKDKCRWNEAMDYCRSRGGRLLTLGELKTMYGDQCPGGDCRDAFWSATEYAPFPRKAWYLDFGSGKGIAAEKIYTAFVRCIVPAGARYRAGRRAAR